MRNEIIAALPELSLIQDTGLRDKVVAVWEESLGAAGFSVDDMKQIPFALLGDQASITLLERVRAVCHTCVAVADSLIASYGKRVSVNKDVLVAGALLADVGKFLEYERRKDGTLRKAPRSELLRHPFTGVGLAFRHGLPIEVMHVIAVHSKEGDHVRRSTEAIIYHHADFTNFELVR
ncbi:MAG TPA: HDIG domain-containing protein [Candidatus Krumholzibacteria bacterium]|nr:HDIG domain-containing protein [Candidatus Krumholzibacteria bacterium]